MTAVRGGASGVGTGAPTGHGAGADAAAAAAELDRIIHERIRLGILSALAVTETLSFNDLKQMLETTDGNLSVHARKLEEAGYVLCEKSFAGQIRAPSPGSPPAAGGPCSATWTTWKR